MLICGNKNCRLLQRSGTGYSPLMVMTLPSITTELPCVARKRTKTFTRSHLGYLHDGDTAEALARLERVDDKRLQRLKRELSHLVGLDERGRLLLLAAGGLADLPGNVGLRASSANATQTKRDAKSHSPS